MGIIKFTFVKLIAKYLFVVYFITQFSLTGNCVIKQKSLFLYNPTPKNNYIEEFSKPQNISALLVADNVAVGLSENRNSQQQQSEEGAPNLSSSANKEIKGKDKRSILGIFLNEEEISSLKKRFTDYGNNHLPAGLRSGYNVIIEKSFEYPVILLFVFLVFFFIVNILIVFVVLNNTIKRKNYNERFVKIFSKMYEEVLLSYMFGSIDWNTLLIKLKRYKRRENRKILISVLMNFKSNFKGELEHFIPEIFTKLGLHNDSIKLASSYSNHKKVKGIIELIHLYPEGAKDIVKKLINDPNDYVRAEAQTAYIRLNPETPFNFFYNLEQPFTRWTQLSAFNLIRIHQLPVPSFGQFLNSKHYNIKNFSLRMIIFFQQLESAPEVVKMVENKMEQTRYLAYKAINDLRLYDSHELIKSRYEKETLKNKLEIIKALKNIGTDEDLDFLEEIMKKGSMTFKTEACRSMYFMSSSGKEKVMQIDKEEVPEIELLIAHVTDSRN